MSTHGSDTDVRNAASKPTVDAAAAPGSPNAMRMALAASAAALARSSNADIVIPTMLGLIGEAIGACHVHVCENPRPAATHHTQPCRYTWTAADVPPSTKFDSCLPLAGQATIRLQLERGEAHRITADNASEPVRRALQATGALSVLIMPVFVDGKWWGLLEIHACNEACAHSSDDADIGTILASLIGAALARSRAVNELTDAARVIENSSTLLFRVAAEKPYGMSYISRNIARYGYSAEEMLTSPTRYLELVHPEDLPKVLEDIVRVSEARAAETGQDIRMRARDGRYLWFECRISAVRGKDNRVTGIEGLAIDIDRRKATESYIARFTLTDQLTGLANRNSFMEELRHAFTAAKRGSRPFAILYIDLDHFKDINDVLGHSKGDALIKLVAKRVQDAVRSSDLVARFGGDEFAILQPEITDASDAGALAARVLRQIAEPPYDLGTQVDVTASIGIACFGPDVVDAEDMIKQCDMALYRAKDSGRNQYHFHSEALDVAIIERVTLASDLRRALDRGEFELYYQPQVDVASRRIIGIEALARWHHPKQGLLLPSHFIPIAEKTGTIVPMGHWVIDQACRQILAWRTEKITPPVVSLNVSAVQLKTSPDFDSDLMQTLLTWKIEPSAIELELTESVLMATTQQHRNTIDRLNALGVSIAIDDFGTGYSSLGYLRAYRVSRLKIAQEFIRNIEVGSGDVAIVRAAISLARELGIQVIAEGVETEYQLRLLTEAGCRYVQGYYFSPPVPAREMTDMLRRGTLSPAAIPPSGDARAVP